MLLKFPDYYHVDALPFGLTYGQWTVKWWRWALSIPKSINPVLDKTGVYAYVGQPERFVWFLSGRFGSEGTNFPERFCTVPVGRSILFPVINYEANPIEYPDLVTEDDLLENVREVENTIANVVCFVDGRSIAAQRVQSDPKIFELDLNNDPPVESVRGKHTFATADGYWVFLKPLEPGDHSISFEGSCELRKAPVRGHVSCAYIGFHSSQYLVE